MISRIVVAGLFTNKQKTSLQSNNERWLLSWEIINGQIIPKGGGWIGYNEAEYTPLQLVFPNLNSIASGVVSDDEAEGVFLRVDVAHKHKEIWKGCTPWE